MLKKTAFALTVLLVSNNCLGMNPNKNPWGYIFAVWKRLYDPKPKQLEPTRIPKEFVCKEQHLEKDTPLPSNAEQNPYIQETNEEYERLRNEMYQKRYSKKR